MIEHSAPLREIARVPESVEFLRLELTDCNLSWGYWTSPGARLMADFMRHWQVQEAERAVSTIQLGKGADRLSDAVALSPRRRSAFEDIDLKLLGRSSLTGSLYAQSVSVDLTDSARSDLDIVDADSVLVTAFGKSRVTIKQVFATSFLVIADFESTVEVENVACDLVLIRQAREARARIDRARPASGDVTRTLFALKGDQSAIAVPADALLVPGDAVDAYWRSLAS